MASGMLEFIDFPGIYPIPWKSTLYARFRRIIALWLQPICEARLVVPYLCRCLCPSSEATCRCTEPQSPAQAVAREQMCLWEEGVSVRIVLCKPLQWTEQRKGLSLTTTDPVQGQHFLANYFSWENVDVFKYLFQVPVYKEELFMPVTQARSFQSLWSCLFSSSSSWLISCSKTSNAFTGWNKDSQPHLFTSMCGTPMPGTAAFTLCISAGITCHITSPILRVSLAFSLLQCSPCILNSG